MKEMILYSGYTAHTRNTVYIQIFEGRNFYEFHKKVFMLNFSSTLSLSTIVLNSRDWWEIIWLPENFVLKNQPCNRLYPKNRLECIGKAVMMLYLG